MIRSAPRLDVRTSAAGRLIAATASRRWALGFAAAAVGIGVLHLAALGTAPPGLYNDEASIGYNAWAVAHHGVDEHGASFPLFFEAFGEYKGPISMYLLAPLTWVAPLTPATERLPSAICGLLIAVLVSLTAWRLTHSRPVALLSLLTAGLLPWLFLDSRTDMEAIVPMVLGFVAALWCLAHADSPAPRRWYAGAGITLGVALFAYTPARVFVGVTAALIALSYGLLQRGRAVSAQRYRGWWAVLIPVIAAYAVLAQWALRHPGALSARFNVLSISSDSPGAVTLVVRFVENYVQYLGAPFLFTHGDANLRHSTGFGGMLFVVTLPALVAGLVVCVRRWRQPLCCLAVTGLLAAPVPAALTMEGTPHSLRASLMLPFLLLIMVYGWNALWPWLSVRRSWLVALAAVVCVEAGGYYWDFFVEYPGRALGYFDAGEGEAIVRAHQLAGGHRVLLSHNLDAPYIQALFWLRPDPQTYVNSGLDAVNMAVVDPGEMAQQSRPGDVLVLSPYDSPPSDAALLFSESVTVTRHTAQAGAPSSDVVVLARAYRR